jgi:hypothetical protein
VTVHIFRVLVRGRFDDLDADARARLLAEAEGHTVAMAGFSEAGTLTYDRTLTAFGFRVQLRERSTDEVAADGGRDEAEAAAVARAEQMATAACARLGAGLRDLRTTAGDMADVWRRQSGGQGSRQGGGTRDRS